MGKPTLYDVALSLLSRKRKNLVSGQDWYNHKKNRALLLPGTFGNLELDVIPKFLAKVLANNEELTLKETKVSERVRERSRECLVCSWGGNRTDYKCC